MNAPAPIKVLHLTREAPADIRYGIGKSLAPVLAALPAHGVEALLCNQATADQVPQSLSTRRFLTLAGFCDRLVNRNRNAFLLSFLAERLRVAHGAAWLLAHPQQSGLPDYSGVTHIHCHDPLLAAAIRHYLPRGHTIKIGYTAHAYGRFAQVRPGVPLDGRLFRFVQRLEKREAQRADFLVAPSRGGLAALAAELGLPPDLPPGWRAIVHPKPQLNLPDRKTARAARNWSDDDFVIIAVGQLITMKNFPLLIEACAGLQFKASKRLRLVIIGDGDSAALLAAAARAGIETALELAHTDAIGDWLAGADLYASVSATESFGMANLEALCAGLPAVCSRVGAVEEILADGARLVEPEITAVRHALQTLIDDPAERARLAETGHRRALAWPDADHVAALYADLYASNMTN